MILFVSKRRHFGELNRAKLREEMLKGTIESALEELRRARHATTPVQDCVEPAISRLSRVLCEVTTV